MKTEISKNKIIISYIKLKKIEIIAFVGIYLILLLNFYLYEIPFEVIYYSLFLALLYVFFLSFMDYRKYKKKMIMLIETKQMIEINSSHMPDTKKEMEFLYQDIIVSFEKEKNRLIFEKEVKYKDMIDYYTMWAHQIKTPLSALKLMIQAREELDKELILEIFKIEQYVEMVLQYLRMEDMSKDLRIEKYSLDNLVKQAVRKYATLFIYQNVSIEVDLGEEYIVSDEKWFVFILEQLISNGIKYNKKGGKVKIYAHPMLKSHLIIEDTGIGIKEEDIYLVFQRGFTGLNGRFDKRSSGIGLYLCKTICNKLSHRIWIESEVDIGTKVIIDYSMYALIVE